MKVSNRQSGFTLVELLVVISILGILAGLTVPALKNLGKSNAAVGASRQLLDGVGRARQLAIANHTTVLMVFLPTNFWNNWIYNLPPTYTTWSGSLTSAQKTAVTNLCDKQLNGYTFIADGAVGDQPGQHAWHYLEPWQVLPEGSFIPTWKFALPMLVGSFRMPNMVISDPVSGQVFGVPSFEAEAIPFPTETSPTLSLPYIAFNYLGQLTSAQVTPAPLTQHEYIPLARGSVLPAMDPSSKTLQLNPPDVSEAPPGNSTNSAYNLVDIDPLTGRAVLQFEKVK